MADNTQLNTGSGGDLAVTREVSHGGDTAKLPGSFIMGVSGTEGSYTVAAIDGDATNGLDVDVTRVSGTVTVDGSGVTQPVSAASLPLPSGAATSANQSTANSSLADIETNTDYGAVTGGGTETGALRVTLANNSTGVVSVDDNGGALTVDGTVAATQSGTWTVDLGATDNAVLDVIAAGFATEGSALGSGVLLQGDDGTDRTNVLVDTDGHLQVDVLSGAAGGTQYTEGDTDASITGTAMLMEGATNTLVVAQGTAADGLLVNLGSNNDVTVTGTVTANLSATDNAVLDAIDSNTDYGAVTGGGTEAGALRVTLANNSTGVLSVDDNGGALTVDGTVTANAGTNLNTSALALESGGNLATVAGAVSGSEMQVDIVSGTVTANLGATDNAVLDSIDSAVNEQASSHYRNIDANAEDEIKGSAGTMFWLHAINLTAAVAYLHLYDATAASVTPGSTTPTYTFPIPTQGDTNGAGFVLNWGTRGQAFANGITLVCTTTTDGSAGDPGTNGVMVNAGYA